ncbi:MAG TPA: CoA transferase [Acidimicrobiales bacterium]|jgi:crotonobetainyl-CoA:carnitine CoA-transferase CaiB-like acyl-CoA transferase|nr:CoA transferase [Acidimicrobiales bacterium]
MIGPLDDLTVLEIANWVAAPSAGALMADMGADVIKVEPLAGDSMRGKLRQPALPEGTPTTDIPFHLDNRGKRSIAVDLGDPRGNELVRELAAKADVVITNLLPARLAKYGLAPDQLRADHPELIYALVTGYGSAGDDADRIAFDLTAFFARGAIMSLVGEPGEPPPAFRPGQGDHPTGLALLSGILAALRVRDRTGQGQVVETALMRTAAWTIGCDVSAALVDRKQPTKRGRNQAISPMGTRYECADGTWVNLSAMDPRQWDGFCQAIDRPELAGDPRFATPVDRFKNAEEIIGILDEHFATQPYAHWAPRLDASGIIWGRVAELPDLVDDPQARAIGMFAEIEHPVAGRFETLAAPFSLSGADVSVRGPGPEVGEHTREVLAQFGVDESRIDALAGEGVVK